MLSNCLLSVTRQLSLLLSLWLPHLALPLILSTRPITMPSGNRYASSPKRWPTTAQQHNSVSSCQHTCSY
jgi:hypothetical protein